MNRLGSEYTSRCELHVSALREFAEYCVSKRWVEEPTKGEYEVLRMTRVQNKHPLLIYRRLRQTEHYTVSGVATILVAAYLRDKRNGRSQEKKPNETPAVVETPEVVQTCVLEVGTAGAQESDPPWK